MTVLRVEGLQAAYGHVTVLRSLNLYVDEQELVALVGANGAGKTTLLRVASGLLPPHAGRIHLFGTDVTGWPAERLAAHGVAHVPQDRLVFPGLTVQDNLDLGAYTQRKDHRRSLETQRQRVFNLFPGLADRTGQRAGSLSGGEQQMLAIGRALMANPRLLLLDEPSLGLAPLLVREILGALLRLRKQEGLTVLLIEQNARAALAISDRAYVLERGRIVLEGPSGELEKNPRVQSAYLGGTSGSKPTSDASPNQV